MTTSELWQWDAVDLAAAIRSRKVSSLDATVAVIERMHAVNPKVNAVVRDLSDEALAAARAADEAVRRGERLGPLHGVPVTIKENVDQLGLPTINGVVAYKDLTATEDSPPVANWKKAGAVIVGRTNTPAFSLRWHTDNDVHGPTLNPWSRSRTSGGSSGGASAALAVGIAPLAHGNDYGGSIRYPAYTCGLAGIRPTMGRVPAFNRTASVERSPTNQLMAVNGPLARKVRDVRVGLAAMSGRDARDPIWVPAPLEGAPPAAPVRVALCVQPKGQYTHPAVAEAVRKAGKALADNGYAVEEVEPPAFEAACQVWRKLVFTETRHLTYESIEKLGDAQARKSAGLWLELQPDLSLKEYMQALAEVLTHRRAWAAFMETYALIIGPNSGDLPFEVGFDCKDVQTFRHVLDAQALMTLVNMLGLPSVAVPVGTTAVPDAPQGLPLGVQIIAQRFREDLALDAAEIVEAVHGITTPIDPVW
ncbi:amidase [Vineibacter terrae]|uniref:Indoleacetamide hydrolase n=1 Tax=Vineibacter terrae TaxID=2586908 RepID=A0A5C8PWC7_9HYPH|nr:amidase [Vineibacter terrae]TXL82345.1 amidase [Vineibacter terrae]